MTTNARTDTLWCTGKRDALVALKAQVRDGDLFLVAAEDERLTRAHFKRGLRQCWPDANFLVEHRDGNWIATPLKEANNG